jgi:proteasome accessory factor A
MKKLLSIIKEIFCDTSKSKLSKPYTELEYFRKRIMGTEQEYGLEGCSGKDWILKTKSPFIENGAKIYVDCNHPEYASPETTNPLDAMIWNKAGEFIIPKKIKKLKKRINLRFFKNNIDSNENSYGTHENYCMPRILVNKDKLYQSMLGFLTTRIIFTGNGSINQNGKYEISQKARTIDKEISPCTTLSQKPIVNTRDESLAGHDYYRFHVVSGDANLSESAIFLKMGTTSLLLDLHEEDRLKNISIENPVKSLHRLSRNPRLTTKIKANGKWLSAMEIQKLYYEQAEKEYRGRDSMTNEILDRWIRTLNQLEEEPMQLSREIDWIIKKNLIDSYIKKTNKKLYDDEIMNINLQYHELENGLFYMLEESGHIDRMVSDLDIAYAIENPPEDTRAWTRGKLISEKKVKDVRWEIITLKNKKEIDIIDPYKNTKYNHNLEEILD